MAISRHLEYVPALDGLRGLAVGAVVLFHLGWPALRWGYLGVDAFFVLSGYLITTLLLRQSAAAGTVQLADFWARRAKRLLPALAVFLVTISAIAPHVSSGNEVIAIRGDVFGGYGYYSNWWLLARGSDYFEAFRVFEPLTHLWSLAIEEQFYILWPLAVMALGAFRIGNVRSATVIVTSAAAVSAILMVALAVYVGQNAAYLNTASRIFEPLVGATAALAMFSVGRLDSRRSRVMLAAGAGLALSAIAIVGAWSSSYYYGGAAIFSIGIGLLILGVVDQPDSRLTRILERRAIVFLGLVSYSLYLWHWPAIQLSRHVFQKTGPAWDIVAVCGALAVATASLILVERPVRRWRATPGVALTLILSVTAVSAGMAAALARSSEPGLLTLNDRDVAILLDELTDDATGRQSPSTEAPTARTQETDVAESAESAESSPLSAPPPTQTPTTAPADTTPVAPAATAAPSPIEITRIGWTGESVALSLAPAMIVEAAKSGVELVARPVGGCGLLPNYPLDFDGQPQPWAPGCPAARAAAMDVLLSFDPPLDAVAIYSGYAALAYARDGVVYGTTSDIFPENRIDHLVDLLDEFEAAGIKRVVFVTLVPPPPGIGGAGPNHWFKRFNPVFAHPRITGDERIVVVDLYEVLCPADLCAASLNGVQLRSDGYHYGEEGAAVVAPILVDMILEALRASLARTRER